MAINEQLDAFLKGEAGTVTEEAAPAPEPAAAPEKAAPEAKASVESTPAKADKAKPEVEDETDPPEALEGEPVIPRRAYEDERRKRQDWKARAVEAETRHKELQRQFEEAQRRAAAPPPPQAAATTAIAATTGPADRSARLRQPPDAAAGRNAAQRAAEQPGNDAAREDRRRKSARGEYVEEFRQLAQADPTLFGKLYSQPHPYNWMTREVDRLRLGARRRQRSGGIQGQDPG